MKPNITDEMIKDIIKIYRNYAVTLDRYSEKELKIMFKQKGYLVVGEEKEMIEKLNTDDLCDNATNNFEKFENIYYKTNEIIDSLNEDFRDLVRTTKELLEKQKDYINSKEQDKDQMCVNADIKFDGNKYCKLKTREDDGSVLYEICDNCNNKEMKTHNKAKILVGAK